MRAIYLNPLLNVHQLKAGGTYMLVDNNGLISEDEFPSDVPFYIRDIEDRTYGYDIYITWRGGDSIVHSDIYGRIRDGAETVQRR